MAEFILDLTGRTGLGTGFSGDIDMVTPKPERIIEDGTGMAGGHFNPYIRNGYCAPTTTTSVSYTADVAPTNQIISIEYDSTNNNAFFAERGRYLYKTDSLTDTSLSQIIDVGSGNTIQDLEIYEIQSKRNLFYLYTKPTVIDSIDLDTRSYWESLSIEVNPVSTTKPSIIVSHSDTFLASTNTIDIDVPTGNNIACTIVISTYYAITHVKLNTVAMTQTYATTKNYGSYTKYTYVYTKTGVSAGTNTIEISAGGALNVNVVFTDNTNTTTPVTINNMMTGMTSTAINSGTYSSTKLLLTNLVVENAIIELTSSPAATSYNPATQTTGGNSVFVSPDGTKMYVSGTGSAGGTPSVFQYTLGTAYDVTTASYASKAVNYSAVFGLQAPAMIQFNTAGTAMFLCDSTYDITKRIETWDLSTAWDVSTATYNAAKQSTSLNNGNPYAIYTFCFSSDGLTLYVNGGESSLYPTIFQYDLSTAWNPSTAAYSSKKLRLNTIIPAATAAICGPILILNNDEHAIVQKETTGNTFFGLNFNPLFPKDISKCTYAISSTGVEETLVEATNSPIGGMSSAGGYFYYRKNGNNYVIRQAPQARNLAGISTDSRTVAYSGSTALWGSISYVSTGVGIECGILKLPASSVKDDTWLSVTSAVYLNSASAYNFIRKADNGFAYLFTNNKVHKIDGGTTGGSTGTVTESVLLFPEYFTVTDALDYRSNMYIAVHMYPITSYTTGLDNYIGRVGLYVWNRISTQLSSADYIELPGVREIKKIYASPDGVLKLITIADNGTTELREFGYNDSGGVVFPVKKRLGIGAFPQVPDGLSTAGDKVTWIANDGNMYCEKGNAVTKLFQIKAPGTGTAGLAQNITSGALLYGSGVETAGSESRTNKQGITFSYLDGSTVYTKKIYPFDLTTGANAAQTPHQGDVYTQVKLIPQGSAIRNVRIYNAPVSGSDETVIATVKLYFNQKTTATMPTGMTKSITKKEASRGYVDFHLNKAYLHALQIEVEWASGTAIGDDMYMPSVAVVTYDELKTQSPDNG